MAEKVAVVTGCSSGIGLLTAVELASRQYRVVATMRNLERREALDSAAKAARVNLSIDVRRLDVTETDSIPDIIDAIAKDYGRIDVLVNNAGFPIAGFAEDVQLCELRQQFETNFFGQVAMTQAVVPTMRAQGSGHIIMLSSISGTNAPPMMSSYASSKFALEGWSESLRIELRSLGIRVVLVEPGAYDTNIWTRNARVSARSLDGTSPNVARARRFRDWVQNGGIKKRDPREVAQLIVRVAEDPNPKLRYLVGPDARTQYFAKTLLPWHWYERLVSRTMKID